MSGQKEISSVMKTLKKNRNKFITPALTEIAKERDPFKVLISCILSLRTRDETTARVSERLYAVAETPQKIAKMDWKEIAKIIRPVNYYKTKAKRIRAISVRLVKEFNSRVPNDIGSLLTFRGVGRKTANIVMVYGFGRHGIPVDTHVHRVSNRIGWVNTKMPEKTEAALRVLLPKRYWLDLNDLFVQFGQTICTPRNPKCDRCPVTRYCKYYREVYTSTNSKL